MNLWRLAFIALVSVLAGVGVGAGTAYVVQRRAEGPESLVVEAPVAIVVAPKSPPRWPRYKAAIVRFTKVFIFVLLGFIAASITSPDGLRAVVDPLNGLVIFVASTVGAVLKYVQWQDVSGEAPSMVTLALAPATPAVLAAPVEGVTE